ncbi:MAG: serine--tRNA ligase [Candidatus Moraniibacteriota bacterium]|nr:MAG: serine--tRNA ligase [Candidatus Moranbacteria bacterium]
MLDIAFIRDNEAAIRTAITNKNLSLDLDALLAKHDDYTSIIQEVEGLRSLKNDLNELIQKAAGDTEKAEIIANGKEIKVRLEEKDVSYRRTKDEFRKLMAMVPNIVSPDTPVGKSDAENKEVYVSGEKPVFDFTPKTHIELGRDLDILDLERGAKVGGYRGYYVKNEGVPLVMGLMMYALQKLAAKGYQPMIPPTLVKGFPLFGSGYFKGLEYDGSVDEVYEIASTDKESDGRVSKEQKFLVGTAEPSLLAYYSGEVLDGAVLPLRLAGFSQCYRSEIGSYGKDTKGMYRVHEFMKVEQVVIAPADIDLSDALQEEMIGLSQEMHEELGLPYRKIQICTGDMSAGKYRAFDLEAWMPGMNRYGETGSASNFLDWQARRLNVKYNDAKTGEKRFVYMLNNTALPTPRILIAILENHQDVDGNVRVPKVLQPFVGTDIIRKKVA